jgi:cell wall-associated NlpC family hydrolase
LSVFDQYVGIPYVDRGRSLVGCDCYGLLHLVFRELRGLELPSFAEDYVTAADSAAIADLINGELEPWHQVEAGLERTFDGVLMRDGREGRHIGIVAAPGLMLHVERGETSRIERYGAPRMVRRLIGFYRFAQNLSSEGRRQGTAPNKSANA